MGPSPLRSQNPASVFCSFASKASASRLNGSLSVSECWRSSLMDAALEALSKGLITSDQFVAVAGRAAEVDAQGLSQRGSARHGRSGAQAGKQANREIPLRVLDEPDYDSGTAQNGTNRFIIRISMVCGAIVGLVRFTALTLGP